MKNLLLAWGALSEGLGMSRRSGPTGWSRWEEPGLSLKHVPLFIVGLFLQHLLCGPRHSLFMPWKFRELGGDSWDL